MEKLAVYKDHLSPVWAVDISPNGECMVTGGSDGLLFLYQRNTEGKYVQVSKQDIRTPQGPTTVRSVRFSPDSKRVAAACFDAKVHIWSILPGSAEEESEEPRMKAVDPLDGHSNEVKSVSWSHDGLLLASTARDRKVVVWQDNEMGDYECMDVIEGKHVQDVKVVSFHPTEDILASASYDNTVQVYDGQEGMEWEHVWGSKSPVPPETAEVHPTDAHGTEAHRATVWDVAWAPQGKEFVTVSSDLSMKLWRPAGEGYEVVQTIVGFTKFVPIRVVWLGDRVFVTGAESKVFVFKRGAPAGGCTVLGESEAGFGLVATYTTEHDGEVNNMAVRAVDGGVVVVTVGDDGAAIISRLNF
ncbi:WD domain, G-beta repeat [Carpediemonas membranifera]|uniref:WD domain, G-beta repeat n=1 Tax=Carpediemonas membranifera TaxID=201153 RepID=A0A8J6BBN2_9EUKA|nr:WD domain, G-beta repeat [Carpediemonas membranifera]|eukprot:KAG9397394.1 WD domain, G-beta repeat [Carpediemonas membranifera]